MANQPPTTNGQNGRSWLRSVLARFTGQERRGDVVAANVEGGARGVAVGKNIVQIGSLTVSAWPLAALVLALLVAIAAGLGAWALARRGPAVMDGQFNVAVADFVELGAGAPRVTEHGRRLGALLFDTLQRTYPQPDPALTLWHDGSVPWGRQGARIGDVANAAAANAAADAVGADLLIYGSLDAQSRVALQLYISRRPRIYGDANAIVGAYRFGEPIQLDPADIAADSDALTRRANALVALVRGLRADSKGQFDAAQSAYTQAEAQLPAIPARSTVRAIIKYFEANSFYYRSLLAAASPDESDALLAEAKRALDAALDNDPNYARAVSALGSVFYEQARRVSNHAQRLQGGELDQAIASYQKAMDLAASSSEPASVAAVAAQGLATAYYLKGATLYALHRDSEAEAVLAGAAMLLTQSPSTLEADREYRLLAQAAQTLGHIQTLRAQLARGRGDNAAADSLGAQATDAYTACVAQKAKSPNDAALAAIASDCD